MSKLDSKANMNKVAKANKLAHKALERYGEPTMTFERLRAVVSEELKGISLSELVIQERQQGW